MSNTESTFTVLIMNSSNRRENVRVINKKRENKINFQPIGSGERISPTKCGV